MGDTMTVADGLTELKRIVKLLPRKYLNIATYSSKRRGGKDRIEGQAKFVKSETKSALDLIKRFEQIKEAINRSNLETTITFEKQTMTVAYAILFKQQYKEMYTQLYNSFVPNAGQQEINQYSRFLGINTNALDESQLAALDLVPELLYKPKTILKKQEYYMNLHSELDKLIEKSNHFAVIEI